MVLNTNRNVLQAGDQENSGLHRRPASRTREEPGITSNFKGFLARFLSALFSRIRAIVLSERKVLF
jgi:hypothetical protein